MDSALSRSIHRAFVLLFVAAPLTLANPSRADGQGWKEGAVQGAVIGAGVGLVYYLFWGRRQPVIEVSPSKLEFGTITVGREGILVGLAIAGWFLVSLFSYDVQKAFGAPRVAAITPASAAGDVS